MLSREQLQRAAAGGGFQVESYEKVQILVGLLESVRAHPFLGSRMALKGGTALNLFVFDLPRLSVDIDLNYIGASERTIMLAERPRVEQALEQVFGRMGLAVKRAPTEHAGGKWRLSYASALGKIWRPAGRAPRAPTPPRKRADIPGGQRSQDRETRCLRDGSPSLKSEQSDG